MQKDNELFIVRPSLKQHYGRTVTKEMEFDEYTEDKTVHQTLKDLILTTEVKKESEYQGVKSTEHSVLTQEVPEGTILIWNEIEGYILPDRPVCKLMNIKEEIANIEQFYVEKEKKNDTSRE